MKSDLTFTIIKPDAVENNNLGSIIELINRNGYKFRAMKMIRMSRELAEKFYDVHKDKPFFNSLVDYMTSGNIVIAVIEKENAVKNFRELIGNTDPAKANPGTIRYMFAQSKTANAIHGSDSDENAKKEIEMLFKPEEIFPA